MLTQSLMLAAEAAGEESNLIRTEIATVILIAISALVAVVARRVNFPYTVALVIAGFLATGLGSVVEVDVSADLILGLLVPPLLFEATLNLSWRKLRADLPAVLVFALLGTLVGTLGVGWVMHEALGLPWAAALAFGALISATDPVAVIAFFKSLGAPKRLTVLVEGESVFNDAVAVVAFNLAIAAALTTGPFSVGDALGEFVVVSAGGLAVGLVLGIIVASVILARVDDALIETTTTLALAYGSFLLAEEFGLLIGRDDLHFSGILAVVSAGLVVGNIGFSNTSPNTRNTLDQFWELLTYLVNSMVFLLIGLTIRPQALVDELPAIALAVVTTLALRAVVVYGFSAVLNRNGWVRPIPLKYNHVQFWGGLRGAISLALALTISTEVFSADVVTRLQAMTFGVVLFTLLIQGTTMATLINSLGLAGLSRNELLQQRHQARIAMRRAGQAEMARLGGDGVVDGDLADALMTSYDRDVRAESNSLRRHLSKHPELEMAMLLRARRDALNAEMAALAQTNRAGLVDTEVATTLTTELNNRKAALDYIEDRWESDIVPNFDRTAD